MRDMCISGAVIKAWTWGCLTSFLWWSCADCVVTSSTGSIVIVIVISQSPPVPTREDKYVYEVNSPYLGQSK